MLLIILTLISVLILVIALKINTKRKYFKQFKRGSMNEGNVFGTPDDYGREAGGSQRF